MFTDKSHIIYISFLFMLEKYFDKEKTQNRPNIFYISNTVTLIFFIDFFKTI